MILQSWKYEPSLLVWLIYCVWGCEVLKLCDMAPTMAMQHEHELYWLQTSPLDTLSSSNVFADNWEDVCDEICRSNIIQRDNQKFARKLNKNLVKLAKERAVLVRCPYAIFSSVSLTSHNPRHKMTTICGLKERAEK